MLFMVKMKDLSGRIRFVFSWVISVLMFLAALGSFQTSVVTGVLVTCIAIVILPPFNLWLFEKYNIKLKFWHKFAFFFVFMLIATFIDASNTPYGEDSPEPSVIQVSFTGLKLSTILVIISSLITSVFVPLTYLQNKRLISKT